MLKVSGKRLVALAALAAALCCGAQASFAADAKTFRLVAGEPRYMDPNMATDFSIYITSQLFEPLYRLGPDGKPQMLQASKIDRSADGRTWTFTLNPAFKWSNGEPVTAEDWEYSWKRILDPKRGSTVASFLYPIEGAEAYNTGKVVDIGTVGIKAVNPTTFQVTTANSAPQFAAVIGLPYLTPVPKKVVEEFGDAWIAPEHILSNGPYKLVSWQHDQSIVMEANPGYGGPKPAIGRVEINIATADLCTSQLRAYEAGESDLATCLPPQDIARVRADATLKAELSPFPLSATVWLQFDNTKAPWSDVRVRKAFALSVDRQAVVDAISDGTAHPATVMVPTDIPGNNPADALTGTPEDGKKLLAEAGFPEGKGFPDSTLTISANRGQPLIAQLLQQMWADNLGVQVKIEQLEENAYRAWTGQRKTESFDLGIQQWYSDYADPANWYGDLILYDPRHMHFANPEFEALVRKADAQSDTDARVAIYKQANKIFEDTQAIIPLYNPTDLWLVKPTVHGLEHEGVLNLYHIGQASLD